MDWKKVEMKTGHRIKKIHNANYAVEIGKNMKFSLVNVGGIDLVDGKKKLALALIWQMVRKHTLQVKYHVFIIIQYLYYIICTYIYFIKFNRYWEDGRKTNCCNGLWIK